MLCRTCGTEIADKAIVCYRCGAGTTDPVRRPAELKPRRRLLGLVVMVLMLLLGLYLGQASRTAADPEPLQLAAGFLVAFAVVLLIVRLLRRR
jgi:hypothetical protein